MPFERTGWVAAIQHWFERSTWRFRRSWTGRTPLAARAHREETAAQTTKKKAAAKSRTAKSMPLIAKRSEPVQRPVVLIIAFGLEGSALQQAIDQAMPVASDDPTPVFLIDHADFSPLTRDGALFEHFPSSASQAMLDSDLPWSRYAERRLDLLVAKWRPISIVPLGKGSLCLLSSWRARRQQLEFRTTAHCTD